MAVATCFTFSMQHVVQGYHMYQSILEAVDCEMLECLQEIGNHNYPYAIVVVVKTSRAAGVGVTIGHVLCKISSICSIFVTGFGKTDHNVTFCISRNTILKH